MLSGLIYRLSAVHSLFSIRSMSIFSFSFSLKDSFHHLPFLITAGICCTTLELAHIRLPLCLPGQSRQSRHIPLPVKIIHGVANHKQLPALAVDLHIQYAHLPLALNNLRPHVLMGFHILGNHLLVINECQRLAIPFHATFLLYGWLI